MCDLCNNGRYYYGEGDHGKCWNCLDETKEVRLMLSLLYVDTSFSDRIPCTRGAYGMKHNVEDLLGRYVSTEELVRAGQVTHRIRIDNVGRTTGFYVKERFPMEWLWEKVTTRPKGAKTAHWDAYQSALAVSAQHRASLPAPPTEGSATASDSQ
jgi:hypothetical protein